MKPIIYHIFFLIVICSKSISQINYTESFDATTFVPTGWTDLLVSGTNSWTRVTSGTFPTQLPRSGAGEAKFNSFNVSGGVRALVSPLIDYTNRSGVSTTISFWMYRDNGYSTTPDKIDIYMNTAPNLTGAILLGTVNRAIGLSPAVVANGWYQYSFTVPLGFTSATNYFILRATSAFGNNIFIDDVSWTSYPPPYTDIATSALISPSGSYSCFGSNQTVSIQVRNSGSIPINFLSNPATINCSVTIVPSNTAIASSTIVISPFILNTGVLAIGATTNVAITNSLNMSVSGTYSFNINTSVNGDIISLNNTLSVSNIFVSKVNSFPYETDFSSLPNPTFLVQQVSGTGNWSNVTTGNMTFPTLAPVLNSGNGYAYFNSFLYSSGTVSNLILPNFDFTALSSPVLDLWVSQDVGYSFSNDRLDVLVSLDGGNTWSASLLTIPRYNPAYTTPGWKLFSIPLISYVGNPCARIAIRATSAYGNNMAIDYLKVYDAAVILPVTLVAFTGEIYNEKQNILFWQTAEEVNTKMFRIDRSYDGINFEPIHFETAKGEFVGADYYYIDDVEKESSIVYYRLVSIDIDNTTDLFKIISIERNYMKDFYMNLYPNPSYSNAVVQINLETPNDFLLELFDSKGIKVSSQSIYIQKGLNNIDLNTNSLMEGLYFVKLFSVTDNTCKSTQKFVKL